MTKIIGLLETIVLFVLSYIVQKENNLIIFGSRKGEYILGNPKIYYLYLNNFHNTNLKLFFFDKNGINNDNRIKTFGNTFKKYSYMLRAKYIIIDNYSFDVGHKGVFIGNFNIIQTWHGEPIKGIGFLSELYIARRNKVVLFFEKLEYKTYKFILSNQATKKLMSGVFNNSGSVINIGLPRNDLLTDPEIQKLNKNEKVENKILNLRKKYQKIFLFSPTFREKINSPYFTEKQLQKINDALSFSNAIIIIKSHPNETRTFLKQKKYSNILNVTNILPFDAIDFLPYIDMIITDYSSIYIDFLLTGKPIIWYQNDLGSYIDKERGLLYDSKDVVISQSTAYNFDTFLKILSKIDDIQKENNYITDYTKLKQKFYGAKEQSSSSCKKLTDILFPTMLKGKK